MVKPSAIFAHIQTVTCLKQHRICIAMVIMSLIFVTKSNSTLQKSSKSTIETFSEPNETWVWIVLSTLRDFRGIRLQSLSASDGIEVWVFGFSVPLPVFTALVTPSCPRQNVIQAGQAMKNQRLLGPHRSRNLTPPQHPGSNCRTQNAETCSKPRERMALAQWGVYMLLVYINYAFLLKQNQSWTMFQRCPM